MEPAVRGDEDRGAGQRRQGTASAGILDTLYNTIHMYLYVLYVYCTVFIHNSALLFISFSATTNACSYILVYDL